MLRLVKGVGKTSKTSGPTRPREPGSPRLGLVSSNLEVSVAPHLQKIMRQIVVPCAFFNTGSKTSFEKLILYTCGKLRDEPNYRSLLGRAVARYKKLVNDSKFLKGFASAALESEKPATGVSLVFAYDQYEGHIDLFATANSNPPARAKIQLV